MPLPWLMIFLFIFICVFSVTLYFTFFFFDDSVSSKMFKPYSDSLPW